MDDDRRNLLLNWSYLSHENSMDGFRQSHLQTMELEEASLKAAEKLKMRDQQILHFKDLLSTVIKERDEARDNCRKMFSEKIFLQQLQLQRRRSSPPSAISSIGDDPGRGIDSNHGFSSDCDESIVSPPPPEAEPYLSAAICRALPEKGKLLQAVVKAGPLLQNLLLAGPLPQWRHPPPPADSHQIPPPPPSSHFLYHSLHGDINDINIDGRITRKGVCQSVGISPISNSSIKELFFNDSPRTFLLPDFPVFQNQFLRLFTGQD